RTSIRIAALIATLAVAEASLAQDVSGYPNRPVRLVVPFAPGGTNDSVGRVVGDKLAARLGQPVVVDNRAGANSIVGCEIVATAAPDGYPLVIVAAGFAANPSLIRKLPYDSLRDFAPVGLVGDGPYLLVVYPSVPAKNLSEFIAWAKARPGQVNYASTGVG